MEVLYQLSYEGARVEPSASGPMGEEGFEPPQA